MNSINNIRKKYNNDELITQFEQDIIAKGKPIKCLIILLSLSIVALIIYGFDFKSKIDCVLIDYSAFGLIFILVVLIIVFIMRIVYVVYRYSSPIMLFDHLIGKKKCKIKLVSKLMVYAIKNDDYNLINKIIVYYRWVRIKYKIVEDRVKYYKAIEEMNEAFCQTRYDYHTYGNIAFDLLYTQDNQNNKKIQESLGQCVYQDVFYKKDNYLIDIFQSLSKAKVKINIFLISKAMEYAIRTKNPNLIDTVYNYIKGLSSTFMIKSKGCIEYSEEYYYLVSSFNELLCQQNELQSYNKYGGYAFELLVDTTVYLDMKYHIHRISDKTYYNCTCSNGYHFGLWNYIFQDLYYNRDNFIMDFWEKAYRYYTNNLAMNHNNNNAKFLEFTYAICGALISANKYNLLKQLIEYTNVISNNIESTYSALIPKNINGLKDIYNYYVENNLPQLKYPLSNMLNIKSLIIRYFAILFIYIYNRDNRDNTDKSYKSLIDSKEYRNVDCELKGYINEYLGKKDILEVFGLESLYNQQK